MMDLETRLFQLKSRRQKIQETIDKNEFAYNQTLKTNAELLKQIQESINIINEGNCSICKVCEGTGEIEYIHGYGFGEIKDCPACGGRGVVKI